MGINSVFNIAKSSLFAHQQALAVTAANLANANNPAYSRQTVLFGTLSPNHRSTFSFGTGIAVEDVLRIRNGFTDVQIRSNNHSYYDAEKRSAVLQKVERLFSEPSEYGLSNLMTQFFNSWDELALEPQSSALRTNVVQSAQLLSDKIENIHSGITQTKSDARAEAIDATKSINTILEQLNTVNKQIFKASAIGSSSNDLIDKRDSILEELSQYVNINVTIDEYNVANVSIGGVFAVDGYHFKQFKIEQNGDRLQLVTDDGAAKSSLTGGSLNGLMDMFNYELTEQLNTLDELALTIMENVNAIHSQGYTITDPAITGLDFFTDYESGKLEINEDILDDPYYLAISDDGASGNNGIALQLAELKNSELLKGKTLAENYSEFISDIANEIRLQVQKTESSAIAMTQLEQTKLEYSGVSTDEEMMNVIKYQRSYDAAAKLISVADELMQTILTLV